MNDAIGMPSTTSSLVNRISDLDDVGTTETIVLWSRFLASSPLAFALVLGNDHVLHAMNTAFEHISDVQAQLVLHRSFREGFPRLANVGVGIMLDRVFQSGEPETALLYEPGDSLRHWICKVWPILDQHQRRIGLILHIQDTTEHMLTRLQAEQTATDLRMVNEQLLLAGLREQALAETASRQAFHDDLTGLANRSLLLDRLAQILPSNQRTPHPYALFLLDIDRFKAVNDSLGHPAGDQLLVEIARRLVMSVRPEDTVARIGGDEFAILVARSDEADEVMQIAKRIQEHLGKPFIIGGQVVTTSASIGIVLSSPAYQLAQDILRDADVALYNAKRHGKAQSVVFDTIMHAQAVEQRRVEGELRYAIAHDELRLQYQPIISLPAGGLIGVEALIRWQHPQRGLLVPADFLDMAEESGLIIPLGEWVLRTACTQMSAWHRLYNQPLYIAVNLSARHLKQHTLHTTLTQILTEVGLAPHFLHLELTEGTMMEDVTSNIALLEHITSLGIHLSIDDFGIGYSSFGYLKRLPFSTVKIDRSFIHDMIEEPNNAAIVAAMIMMAHRLGLKVIMEGIETEAQLTYVRAEGADGVQGYLLGYPLSAAEMDNHLAQANGMS